MNASMNDVVSAQLEEKAVSIKCLLMNYLGASERLAHQWKLRNAKAKCVIEKHIHVMEWLVYF